MTRNEMVFRGSLGAAIGLSLAAGHVDAQALSQEELTRLVQAQAQEIRELEARLKTVESKSAPVATASDATAGSEQSAQSLESRVAKVEAIQSKAPQVTWSKGAPQFTSSDGSATFRPRGQLYVTASSTAGSEFSARNISGTEIRSVRLGFEGTFGRLGYALEGDFADNGVAWKSAYLTVAHKLFGADSELTVGNRLNDRGLDGSTADNNTSFAERNVVGQLILPQRGLFGVGLTERVFGEDWHASFSVAGNDLSNPGTNNDSLTYATRVHWNPVRGETATVHLGGWAFHEDIGGETSGVLRNSPLSGHFNDLVGIVPGTLAGPERDTGYGLEVAGFFGPAWTSGEWGRRDVSGLGTMGRYDASHDAWALSGGWFLVGGHPAYVARNGTMGRVKVADPVTAGGLGAWELKARYEDADYTEMPGGGEGHAWTVGMNWYWNDVSRLILEVVRWQTDNVSGPYIGDDRGYTVNGSFQIAF